MEEVTSLTASIDRMWPFVLRGRSTKQETREEMEIGEKCVCGRGWMYCELKELMVIWF